MGQCMWAIKSIIMFRERESGKISDRERETYDLRIITECGVELKRMMILSADLPDMSLMLPPFIDNNHCLTYHLTAKGKSVADRVVTVLGYACPDITYSPTLYPITAILLHFLNGMIAILQSLLSWP